MKSFIATKIQIFTIKSKLQNVQTNKILSWTYSVLSGVRGSELCKALGGNLSSLVSSAHSNGFIGIRNSKLKYGHFTRYQFGHIDSVKWANLFFYHFGPLVFRLFFRNFVINRGNICVSCWWIIALLSVPKK